MPLSLVPGQLQAHCSHVPSCSRGSGAPDLCYCHELLSSYPCERAAATGRVRLSAELHCEFYLLNMDGFAVVVEGRFAYTSGNG